MKKIVYILGNVLTDIRENFRIAIFSMVFVYLCFFYISDLSFIDNAISNIGGLVDTYYFNVVNKSISYEEVKEKMEEYGIIHYVVNRYSTCDDESVGCFVYDPYILEHISYSFRSGKTLKDENDVILSNAFSGLYDVGDQIKFSVYFEDGSFVTKTKNVCGILKDNTIFYPIATGSDLVDFLFVQGDDTLFFQKSIISIDEDLMSLDPGNHMMFLIEPKSNFNEEDVEEMVVDWGDYYSGKQIIDDNYAVLKKTRSKNRIIVTAGFTVSLAAFLGSIYISFVRRRKEHAILMLCGGSRIGTSVLLKMNEFCSMILGTSLGIIFAIISKKTDFFQGEFYIIHVIGVVLCEIVVYCLCSVLIEFCWKKDSIVELMRKNN